MMSVQDAAQTTAEEKAAADADAAAAAADTSGKAKAPDASAKAAADAAADAAAASGKKAEGGDAATRTVTMPEEDVLAMQRDIDELKASRDRSSAEASRERGRTRKARESLREVETRKTASPETHPALTADTIAEAMVKALSQARPGDQRPPIPGLKYEPDGEVTFQGRPIDPDVAEILVTSKREGDSLTETVQRLEAGQAEITARFEAEDNARSDARQREVEDRHITRMEDYGVSLCDQALSHLDDGIKELATENFYANLGRVLHGLDQRGVEPEEITPELIVRISTPIIDRLSERFGTIRSSAQEEKSADAKEKEPLKRGGSAAEPGRPDPDKMTPEAREAWLDKTATDLAAEHGVSHDKAQKDASSRRRAY